jgi:hypothetical protein
LSTKPGPLVAVHAEVAIAGDLVEHTARRGDGVGPEKQRAVHQFARCDHAPGERLIPGDVAIQTGFHLCAGHEERDGKQLGRFAVRVTGLEREQIPVAQRRVALEARLDPALGGLGRSVVEPTHEPQREEVLASLGLARAQTHGLDSLARQFGELDLDDSKPLAQRRQRVVVVTGLLEVARGERIGIDDEHSAATHVFGVGPERCRIHRHQNVRVVGRCADVSRGEVDLEG